MKKVLLTATVQSHICQFHKPLVKLLHDNGYEVHIAARNNLAEKNGLALDFADKVYDVPFDRSPLGASNFSAYSMLKKIIDSENYEFIHTNTPAAGVYTRLAARKARKNGTCVIYTAHGFHFYKGASKKNWLLYYPIEKACARMTDKLITITTEDYELASKDFKTNVYHIHGVGANSKKFFVLSDNEKEQTKKDFGFDNNTKILLNVGELLPNKNQKTAILALKKIKETYPDTKLLIAGNGPELDNLKALAADNCLDNNVIFLGYTLELNKYVNIADCVVACSYREGLPLNVMEAMMCGKAVVASNNRGHRELIDNNKTGFIVYTEDYNAFAEKICEVLSNPTAFSQAALEKSNLFTDTNIYNELKDVYFG